MAQPRRRLMSDRPMVIYTKDQELIFIDRSVWKRIRAKIMRSATLSAGLAVMSLATVLYLEICRPPDVPHWILTWNAIAGLAHLLFAVVAWRYEEQKVVRHILALVRQHNQDV
jgi:hypothetical protein